MHKVTGNPDVKASGGHARQSRNRLSWQGCPLPALNSSSPPPALDPIPEVTGPHERGRIQEKWVSTLGFENSLQTFISSPDVRVIRFVMHNELVAYEVEAVRLVVFGAADLQGKHSINTPSAIAIP